MIKELHSVMDIKVFFMIQKVTLYHGYKSFILFKKATLYHGYKSFCYYLIRLHYTMDIKVFVII